MKKPTLKTLNDHLHQTLQQYDMVKGEGYFYFCWSDNAPADTPEPPESIYVPALNQMSITEWERSIDGQIDKWLEVHS